MNTLTKSLIALCIPIFFLMQISIGCGKSQQPFPDQPTAAQNAELMEMKGIMTASEYLKLHGIFSSYFGTTSVSDADVDWIVNLIRTPPTTKGTVPRKRAAELRVAQISGYICVYSVAFNKKQENKLYDTAVWLCSSSDAVYREEGAPMIGYFQDSRGIPILLKLSKDSKADVRFNAVFAIRKFPAARRDLRQKS